MSNPVIYFALCFGRIKIGTSKHVEHRLEQLAVQTSETPVLLGTIVGTFRFERVIHSRLGPYRIRGEWFRDCPEVRAAIQALMEYGPSAVGSSAAMAAVSPTKKLAPYQSPDAMALITRIRKKWPVDTVRRLANAAGVSERGAIYWLSGQRYPGGRNLLAITAALADLPHRPIVRIDFASLSGRAFLDGCSI